MAHSPFSKTLLDLDHDVLYQLCEVLNAEDARRSKSPFHDERSPPGLLPQLCATCKTIRYIGTPFLYRSAKIIQYPGDVRNVTDQLQSLAQREHLDRIRDFSFIMRDSQVDDDYTISLLHATVSRLLNLTRLALDVPDKGVAAKLSTYFLPHPPPLASVSALSIAVNWPRAS